MRILLLAIVFFAPASIAHAQMEPAYAVVGLVNRHYANAPLPEWVLVRRIAAPSSFQVVQQFLVPGCTVTGQPRVAIGARAAIARALTFVSHTGIVRANVAERVELGIGVSADVYEWWEAYAVPPAVRAMPPSLEIVALEAELSGFSRIDMRTNERASRGAFASGCDGAAPPALAALTGRSDGFLLCADGAISVISSWDMQAQPGAEMLASYRTVLLEGGGTSTWAGRFVHLLRRDRERLIIVATETGFAVHRTREAR